MRAFISKLVAKGPTPLEYAALAAIALISIGVALIYPPAGYIVGGALVLLATIDARR
jgi:hypothetical protein